MASLCGRWFLQMRMIGHISAKIELRFSQPCPGLAEIHRLAAVIDDPPGKLPDCCRLHGVFG